MSLYQKGWVAVGIMLLFMLLPQTVTLHYLGKTDAESPRLEQNGGRLSGVRTLPETIPPLTGEQFPELRRNLLTATLLAAGAVVLFAGTAAFGLRRFFRGIVRELDLLAGTIDGTSFAAKVASTHLSDGAHRQSSAIEQTARSHRQIASLSQSNAQQAGTANDRIQHHIKQIEAANDRLQHLIQSMGDIERASEGIKKIVDDINSISSKTNLLALNAGVESVKAGESGRTFGVIAKEVRALSLDSGASALQTNDMVSETIRKITTGSETLGQVVSVFDDAIGGVGEIKDHMTGILTAARDQSDRLRELESALEELATLNRRNVDYANGTDRISRELQENSDRLRHFLGGIIQKTLSGKGIDENRMRRMIGAMEEQAKSLCRLPATAHEHGAQLLAFRQRFGKQVEAVYTCRTTGTFIYSDPPAGIDNARTRSWWQKAITGETYVSPLYVSAITGRPCCTISAPITSADRGVTGVIGIDITS